MKRTRSEIQGLDPTDTRGVDGVEGSGRAACTSSFQWAGACYSLGINTVGGTSSCIMP